MNCSWFKAVSDIYCVTLGMSLIAYGEWCQIHDLQRFSPQSSVGKESACNAGDPSSIPGSGRSAGEGIGYPLQYSQASLVAQLVKNLPAMWETWVQSLGWGDPLEKGKASHSSIVAWRIPGTCTVYGVAKSQTWLSNFHFHFQGPVLIMQSFRVAEVLLQWKRTKKASDIDIRRGTESDPLASLIKSLYTFTRPTPTTCILR